MLDHVVEDEQSELEALVLVACEASGDELATQALHYISNKVTVSLEKGAHELSSGNLQVILISVLMLDQLKIISIKSVVLILDLVLVGNVLVLGDALE